jgi:hypothetical protein
MVIVIHVRIPETLCFRIFFNENLSVCLVSNLEASFVSTVLNFKEESVIKATLFRFPESSWM